MRELLESADLILQISNKKLAKNIAEYYLRNKMFLEEFQTKRDDAFYGEKYQRKSLKLEIKKAAKNECFRYYISTKSQPRQIIGVIALNDIIWGCFRSCFLGYSLDSQLLCRGYMTQAVTALMNMAFEELKLHRIEANVMPRNKASLRVLEKCGFENEGISKKYLKINGEWQDHIHMVKLGENI